MVLLVKTHRGLSLGVVPFEKGKVVLFDNYVSEASPYLLSRLRFQCPHPFFDGTRFVVINMLVPGSLGGQVF